MEAARFEERAREGARRSASSKDLGFVNFRMSNLELRNPLPGDGDVTFLAEPHVYLVDGKPIRTSVTGMLKPHWPGFDGQAVVDRYFGRWLADESSKYHDLIRLKMVEGKDEAACKRAILLSWDANRDAAADAGTSMHADLQAIVEGWPIGHEETHETQAFRRWLERFCRRENCEVFRSELIVCLERHGTPMVAGQIDLVLRVRDTDKFILVDYKRTNPKLVNGKPTNLLSSKQRAFGGECGSGPFEGIEATDFSKYSAQLNLYARIAAESYGLECRNRMLLLQIHPDLPEAHMVRVPRMDREIDMLLELEASRMSLEP